MLRTKPFLFLLLILLQAIEVPIINAATEQQWRSILFDGEKVGHGLLEREIKDNIVISREFFSIKTRQRGHKSNILKVDYVTEEQLDGKPLRFSRHITAKGMNLLVEGLVKGDLIKISTNRNGIRNNTEVKLDVPVLFTEAQRNLFRSNKLKSDGFFKFHAFDTTLLRAVPVELATVNTNDNLPGLLEVVKTTFYSKNKVDKTIHLFDENKGIQRIITTVSNMQVEIINCDKKCALAPNKSIDHATSQLIRSPYSINKKSLSGAIRFTLESLDGSIIDIPETYEQHVRNRGSVVEIDICRNCGQEAPPSQETLELAKQANIWLQSDHPILQKMVKHAVKKGRSDYELMKRLTKIATRRIDGEIYYLGYNSALEAARSGRGDCTESALLLAALGRAAGIPTRVASGLVYSNERYHGISKAFAPHAWVQAWVDGRWVSFDSALGNFDSSHIVFDISHGEHSGFLNARAIAGNLRIKTAARIVTQKSN